MTVNTFYSHIPYPKPDEHGHGKNKTKIVTSLKQCLLNSTEIALLGTKWKTTHNTGKTVIQIRAFKAKSIKMFLFKQRRKALQ